MQRVSTEDTGQFTEVVDLIIGTGFTGEGQTGGIEPAGTDPVSVCTENIGGKGVADEQDLIFSAGFDVRENMVKKGFLRFLCTDFF